MTLHTRPAHLVAVGRFPSLTAGIVVGYSLVWSGSFGDAELDTVYESNGRGKKVRRSSLVARRS